MNTNDSETITFMIIMVLFSVGIILWFRRNQELFRKRSKDPVLEHIKNKVRPVHSIVERLEFFEDPEASYTLDKEDVYLCLRDPNTQKNFKPCHRVALSIGKPVKTP